MLKAANRQQRRDATMRPMRCCTALSPASAWLYSAEWPPDVIRRPCALGFANTVESAPTANTTSGCA
eukprot:9100287-Pyramimonas_sp.AAC.1